jgi:hypothetical protein
MDWLKQWNKLKETQSDWPGMALPASLPSVASSWSDLAPYFRSIQNHQDISHLPQFTLVPFPAVNWTAFMSDSFIHLPSTFSILPWDLEAGLYRLQWGRQVLWFPGGFDKGSREGKEWSQRICPLSYFLLGSCELARSLSGRFLSFRVQFMSSRLNKCSLLSSHGALCDLSPAPCNVRLTFENKHSFSHPIFECAFCFLLEI